MKHDYDADVKKANQHHGRRAEFIALNVLTEECKLVSLILHTALFGREASTSVGGLGTGHGAGFSSFFLTCLVHITLLLVLPNY